ncbi:tetraspanin Tsp3 [Ophiocordyceps camponoti-floridani]|uniref:Tetraspanin Tsp3 n=1 Tax=Ophiocordyceps camponoti-floridani TaxID=2030778 RepID=A0A8H4Q4T6_9HYPO|nr:tetraspanin Tsp3 [Ophiocordyceps camponoti-floridani]
MFFNPGIVYMLASVSLSAIAVVVHFHISHLSLPFPPPLTMATTMLPLAAFLNAYVYPNLLLASSTSTHRLSPTRLAPLVLQATQALVTAVLATALLLRGLVPSSAVVEALLEGRQPWAKAMKATSALDLAVVLAVGLMQLLGLLLMRERTVWWTALRTQDWKADDEGRLLASAVDEDGRGVTVRCRGGRGLVLRGGGLLRAR